MRRPKRTLAERRDRASELASRYLADANEASERCQHDIAQKLWDKSQFWHDRYTLLNGEADRPAPRR